VTVPGPPLALTALEGPASDTLHFGADGPVTDSVAVDPHAVMKNAVTMMTGLNRTIGVPNLSKPQATDL
jgi:hypothetical protein